MYQIYQVLPGETLESISKKINISIDELRRLNGIGDNASIKEGSYIIIPNSMSNYKKYIVKQGDSIYKIAKENNVDYNTLLRLNGLKDDEYIYPNQEIIIPLKNTYVTKEKDKIKDVLNNPNITIMEIEELYLEPDQIITY